jgi:hypothetical protein
MQQIDRNNGLIQTSQVQPEYLSGLLAELARLGEARQASLSDETYAIYAEELSGYELQDVRVALRALAREPKEKYEPSFPRLDTLLERADLARNNRMFPPTPITPYVPCGRCFNGGYVYVDANGDPCDGSAAPNRTLGRCACYQAWSTAKQHAREKAEGRNEAADTAYGAGGKGGSNL